MRKTLTKPGYKTVGKAGVFTHAVLLGERLCKTVSSYPVLSLGFTQFVSTCFGYFVGVAGRFYTFPTGLYVAKEV